MSITPTPPHEIHHPITLYEWLEKASKWKRATRELVSLWFENELGSQRELAGQLGISRGTVSHHIKVLRETKDQSMEAYPEHPEQKRTKTVRPVEKEEPIDVEVEMRLDLLMLNQQEQGEPDEEALFRCWSPMMATIPGTAR